MTESGDSSKLLELLDALSTPDSELAAVDVSVSEELEQQIRSDVLNTLNEFDSGAEDASRQQQLVMQLARQPQALLLLRSMLKDAASVEQLGPVPDDLINNQLSKILSAVSIKPADFTVLLSRSDLRYTGKRPQRTVTSYDMARDSNEAPTLLQHVQRLNHCEVKVTIEAGASQSFAIVLDFTFIDPQYRNAPIAVNVTDDAETVQRLQLVSDASLEFEDLPSGSFTIEVRVEKIVIDQFRAELRLEEHD